MRNATHLGYPGEAIEIGTQASNRTSLSIQSPWCGGVYDTFD